MQLKLLSLVLFATGALAQQITPPPGGSSGGAISGLSTGKVPKAASATSIADSACLSESGSVVSFGSCTATIGSTVLAPNQISTIIVNPPLVSNFGSVYPGFNEQVFIDAAAPQDYANAVGRHIDLTLWNGHNSVDNSDKKTPSNTYLYTRYPASGQRFGLINIVESNGAGDAFAISNTTVCGGYDTASGDEGCGGETSSVEQTPGLYVTSISAVSQTACSTVLSADIAKSTSPTDYKILPVASTTGCSVGDWITIGQGVFNSTDTTMEVVQIHATGTGTISAILQSAHTSEQAVTPAVQMVPSVIDTRLGQDRIWVNLSGPAYSTGTITSVTVDQVVGSGTTWTTNMVGGDANLVGCIAFSADTVATGHFSATPMLAWFPIQSRTDNTHMTLAVAYTGGAPTGSAAYIIRPCARTKAFATTSSTSAVSVTSVLLESNSMAWSAADSIEQSISPYTSVQHIRLTSSYWYGIGSLGAMEEFANNNYSMPFRYGIRFQGGNLTSEGKDAFVYGISFDAQTRECVLCLGGKNTNGIGISFGGDSADAKKISWAGTDQFLSR